MQIQIRKGNTKDLDSFLHLLQDVRQQMEHKEWFYLDPPEDVRRMMEDGSMQLWVAMDGMRMAAAFDMILPGLNPGNYGYDLNFSDRNLLRVINMDTAAVHPDYRGLGLQRRLMQEAEMEIRKMGRYILLCTIHPENRFSLNNALKQGYRIERKLCKYGSVRYILRKDIE